VGRASARRATGLTRGRWASGALMVYSLLTMARVEVRQCLTVISLRAQGRGRAGVCRARPTGARFIAALRDGERVERACAAAMISSSFAYQQRRSDPAFRLEWNQARADAPRSEWQRTFLRVLAEQQNVSRAIAAATRVPSYVYRIRAQDREFRARWDQALTAPRQRPAWQAVFLSALAETKHITRARLAAGVASSLVYPESPAAQAGVLITQ